MIALARSRTPAARRVRTTFVEADFLAYPLPDASFDFACANTALHHMDFAAALTAMARLLRPGGRLAVVGLAANRSIGGRAAASRLLPGVRYRRHLLWRYSLLWRKPA